LLSAYNQLKGGRGKDAMITINNNQPLPGTGTAPRSPYDSVGRHRNTREERAEQPACLGYSTRSIFI
jgi:hypothetical protein